MPAEQLSPDNYAEAARKRLGNAVTYARLAAGFNYRREFAEEAKISECALDTLEPGRPGVDVKARIALA